MREYLFNFYSSSTLFTFWWQAYHKIVQLLNITKCWCGRIFTSLLPYFPKLTVKDFIRIWFPFCINSLRRIVQGRYCPHYEDASNTTFYLIMSFHFQLLKEKATAWFSLPGEPRMDELVFMGEWNHWSPESCHKVHSEINNLYASTGTQW